MKSSKCPKCRHNIEDVIAVTLNGLFIVHLCTNCLYVVAERSDSKTKFRIEGDTAVFEVQETLDHYFNNSEGKSI